MNSNLKTFSHTYYFSMVNDQMASGERKRLRDKQRERFKEPKKLVKTSLGFDLRVTDSIKYRNTTSSHKLRDWSNPIYYIDV